MNDKYADGDCILCGYTLDDFSCEDDITAALKNETPETAFEIDESGIYHA